MSALLEQWPIGDGMWILVLTLFALRPSLQVYYSKHVESCSVLMQTSACLQSLLFSEDEELDRFSLKSIKPSYPFLITILWPIGYCRTVLILVHQSNVGHAPFSTGGIRYALEGPHVSEAEAEPDRKSVV